MRRGWSKQCLVALITVSMIASYGCGGTTNEGKDTESVKESHTFIQEESTVETALEKETQVFEARKEERFDFTPEGATAIMSNTMVLDEKQYSTNRNEKCFNYSEGDMNISFKFENDDNGELSINGIML